MRAKETTGAGCPVPGTPLSLGQAGTLVTEVMCLLHLKAPPSVLKEALPLSQATMCKSFPEHSTSRTRNPGTGQLCNMRSEKFHNRPSILLLFGDLPPSLMEPPTTVNSGTVDASTPCLLWHPFSSLGLF